MDATSIPSMALKVIAAWRPRPVLPAQTNASSVGGRSSLRLPSFFKLEYVGRRHHSNPVGTSWQWKTDDAKTVCQGAIDNHYKMINVFKGVPGVLPQRLAEGRLVNHGVREQD